VQVRPLYTFLQREIQARASSPIVDRVMYDDVNEFFWLQERFKAEAYTRPLIGST
jgi:hypothetical protein